VRRDLRRAGEALAAPTAALAAVAAFGPGRLGLALRVYALLLAAVALSLLVAALRRAYPPETPLRPRRATRPAGRRTPAPLARLEQEVALGAAWSFDLHHRLRPRMRGLAAELLSARRGVSLDDAPEQARALLGGATWELVRADRPPPADRRARGIAAADLAHAVETLERL
jgi:hypothetical protein